MMSKIEIEAPSLVLWRIEGSDESGGSAGPVVILALTADPCVSPDPAAALEEVYPRAHFYEIDHIRRVRSVADLEYSNGALLADVANQTGLEMAPEVARVVASLIIDGIRESHGAESFAKIGVALNAQNNRKARPA